MSREILYDLCRRLLRNVEMRRPDMAEAVLQVPASLYADPVQWEKEMQDIFLRMPLLTALSCDLPAPGDFVSYTLAGRPLLLVRGDDGTVRTFLNVCRHRGARLADATRGQTRRFVCPYHAWSYGLDGHLLGMPDRDSVGLDEVAGLTPLPTEERAGAVFSCLSPGAPMDLEAWLGDMLGSLQALRLDELYPYPVDTTLASPNWKLAADGYLDGYHIGFLHKDTIGRKGINNRNTYDLFGPHVRIGFANKGIRQVETLPPEQWNLPDCMSLVHYVFPNVSISGGHGDTVMLSRLFPGPDVTQSTTVQTQYFREPVEGDKVAAAEQKRQVYEQVVRDEDCATIFGIGANLPAMSDAPILFGRNEPGNQRLHQFIAQATGAKL